MENIQPNLMPIRDAIFTYNETDKSMLYENYTTATYRSEQSIITVHASLSPVLNTPAEAVAGSIPTTYKQTQLCQIEQLTGIYLLENYSAIPSLG